jgi:hypothetical protein
MIGVVLATLERVATDPGGSGARWRPIRLGLRIVTKDLDLSLALSAEVLRPPLPRTETPPPPAVTLVKLRIGMTAAAMSTEIGGAVDVIVLHTPRPLPRRPRGAADRRPRARKAGIEMMQARRCSGQPCSRRNPWAFGPGRSLSRRSAHEEVWLGMRSNHRLHGRTASGRAAVPPADRRLRGLRSPARVPPRAAPCTARRQDERLPSATVG